MWRLLHWFGGSYASGHIRDLARDWPAGRRSAYHHALSPLHLQGVGRWAMTQPDPLLPFSVPSLRRPRVVRTQRVGVGLHGHPLLAHVHLLGRAGLLARERLLAHDGHLDVVLLLERHADRFVLLYHFLVEAHPALFLLLRAADEVPLMDRDGDALLVRVRGRALTVAPGHRRTPDGRDGVAVVPQVVLA